MASKNCPNCAAPYDVSLNKCPYCGTSYFDLSAIDICSDEPFYLKLKSDNMIFTSKVVAKPDASITISKDITNIVNGYDDVVGTVVTGQSVDIDIGFRSVASVNDTFLYTVFVNEE